MKEYKQTIKHQESNLYNNINNIENISPSIEFKNIDLSYGDNNVHKNFCLKIKKMNASAFLENQVLENPR